MIQRRTFIGALGSSLAAAPLLWTNPRQAKRLALVTTEWRFRSHAWHMGERFLAGYPMEGRWHRSPIELVSAYVDQEPKNDLSRHRAREFGFHIYPTIAEALRCGGDKLAVDVVLLIGEHGKYPVNDLGQTLYPRYEFFKEIIEVFKQDGLTVPVFNDKHLSWKWAWAKEMVDTARAMGFPFLAGSSLPVTWRMPDLDMPYGAEVEEVMCVAMGGVDSYDFHALETIQCMAERRRGGETGVAWLQGLRGDRVWDAMGKGSFDGGGWDPQLFHSCLSRSHTLAQAEDVNHRYPTSEQIRQWVEEPGRLSFPVQRWIEGHHAALERPGRRLHLRRPAHGPRGSSLYPGLPSPEPQRRLFSGPDVQGGGDGADGKSSLSGGTDAADHRPGRGWMSVTVPRR